MNPTTHWYAIKTRSEARTQAFLESVGVTVYAPRKDVRKADHSSQTSSQYIIPRVLLMQTSEEEAIRLEKESRGEAYAASPFWIYRLPGSDRIQPISTEEFNLFRLLTTDNPDMQCEVYDKSDFHIGQHVRVTAGPFPPHPQQQACRCRDRRHLRHRPPLHPPLPPPGNLTI